MITQSTIIRDQVLEILPESKIEVIPNGITLPSKRSEGDKIISIGRLHEVKGIKYLIEAVRNIENCPELIIAGFGPEEENLKRMAIGLNIRFVGVVLEVEGCFMQGRFFVLPSLSEGLPQTMLEAMSYGLPVIATKVGGIPDVIEHGKTGFLIEPGNSEEIKKYIEILLEDEKLCEEMSDNCLREIQKYSWDRTVKRFEEVMRRSVESDKANC